MPNQETPRCSLLVHVSAEVPLQTDRRDFGLETVLLRESYRENYPPPNKFKA